MRKILSQSLLALVCLVAVYGLAFLLPGPYEDVSGCAMDVTFGHCHALSLLASSTAISLALIMMATCFIWHASRRGKGRFAFWQIIEKHLSCLFTGVWILGFCVYLTGMYIGDIQQDMSPDLLRLFCQVPMACFYAFGMFVFQSDVSAIQPEFYHNLMLMSLFSLVHAMAAVVSLAFVLKYFGFAIVSKMRLFLGTHMGEGVDELYVFWGMNDASYYLATDINRQYDQKKKVGSYRLLVVKTTEDETEQMEASAISRLFSFVTLGKEELRQYKELDCLTENVFHRLSKVEVDGDAEYQDILLEKMDAASLVRLIEMTRSKVHIFLLGNDEENNIICTGNLCRDISIRDNTASKEVAIYCHARYDSVNRVIEDRYSSGNLSVKVIDSSHDSVNLLRSNASWHPINFVDLDTQDNFGTVTSGFTSLVIGFGETGRDAVRYLYEFGAFVDSHSARDDDSPEMAAATRTALQVSRSPFRCYVLDRDAEQLMGQFKANAPSMQGIEYWNDKIFSTGFYHRLDAILQDLNYVVIALGDDEQNITAAVHVFNYVRRHRKDLRRFGIFVRCHSDEHRRHLQNIADHYSQGSRENTERAYINIFGTDTELYTYGQIVENVFVREGRVYNEMYCVASGKRDNEWAKRRHNLLGKRTLDALGELRRKESQDVANAYHAATKLNIIRRVVYDEKGAVRKPFRHLPEYMCDTSYKLSFRLRQTFDEEGRGSLCRGIVTAEGDFTPEEQLFLRNLARLEHFRWNAAHEVLGYRSYADGDKDCRLVADEGGRRHGCNETYKLHNCLVDWQKLDPETNDGQNEWHPDYKLFDFIVISTTLLLHQKHTDAGR